MPAVTEPLWLSLKANVTFIPAMTQKDLAKAVVHVQKAVKKY